GPGGEPQGALALAAQGCHAGIPVNPTPGLRRALCRAGGCPGRGRLPRRPVAARGAPALAGPARPAAGRPAPATPASGLHRGPVCCPVPETDGVPPVAGWPLGVGRRLDVVSAGPGPALFRGEAAAPLPALLGGLAA